MPEKIAKIVAEHGNSREHLLAILHAVQEQSGDNSLHREDIEALAGIMHIPSAEILSTAGFYSMFSLVPRGRHILRVCDSPPCYILGADNIVEAVETRLAIRPGETTPDGMFTLETSGCLGACGVAPVMMIDHEIYGHLTYEKVMSILDDIIEKES